MTWWLHSTDNGLSLAVLDVLESEPLPPGDPLWQVPGLIITSHTAAWSRPEDVIRVFAANHSRWIAGEELTGTVNFDRGY